jgi:small subunit ribosomal protein S4
MGDPKKLRKKYRTPSHPWQKLRIEEEKVLMREYGFKNKSEIWKIDSMLKDFKTQVKLLVPKTDEASERQKQQLIAKVQKLNLLRI